MFEYITVPKEKLVLIVLRVGRRRRRRRYYEVGVEGPFTYLQFWRKFLRHDFCHTKGVYFLFISYGPQCLSTSTKHCCRWYKWGTPHLFRSWRDGKVDCDIVFDYHGSSINIRNTSKKNSRNATLVQTKENDYLKYFMGCMRQILTSE